MSLLHQYYTCYRMDLISKRYSKFLAGGGVGETGGWLKLF